MVTAAPAHAQPAAAGITIDADLTLDRQGVLKVVETVNVPEGEQFTMALPLRLRLTDDVERVFRVTDVDAKGAGTATVAGDQFTIEAGAGASTFTYAIHNTVRDAPGTQVFHWIGVVNTDLAKITASVIAPSYEMGIVDCKLGPPGNVRPCADVRVEATGALFLEQTDVRKGDAIDLTLQLPPGTVPANADIREDEAGPFALTGPVWLAFGVLLAALAALAVVVVRARQADAAATAGSESLDPLERDGAQVRFVSPDGILPGEAGLVLDAHADPVDIAATVVDLAVRRYIWVAPIGASPGGNDWRISRINPPDDQLRDYERTVYTALLPEGVEAVTVGELRAPGRVAAEPIRKAMVADAVARGALTDRSRPGLPVWVGAALIVAGIAAAIGLAVSAGHALVGVAIALAGVAVALLPTYLPVRTGYGRELAGRVRALQRGLENVRREQIPDSDQETVFSRALPFTVISGRADNWVRVFRDLNPAADSQPGLYWFGGFERDANLQRFAGHFPYFITAMEGLFGDK
ncbi:DUF2207 domain-containing protein [Nocardia sp. NEAU-351]|uniref:DUF2207 domain-containing protein n=2 Tax=Nocardia bovistercoris TaxID=2785916 RepID=A0A931N4V2_9NOCA|nr:DUF2207 domain-containing protein [Nocardia bovistercoris]